MLAFVEDSKRRFLPFMVLVLALQMNFSNGQDTSEACCKERAKVVPVVTYIVDTGLPLLLLLAAYLILRARKAKEAEEGLTTTTLPLLETGQQSKPAFSPVPVERVSPCGSGASSLPDLVRQSLNWLAGQNCNDSATKKCVEDRLAAFATADADRLLAAFVTAPTGVSAAEAEARLSKHGPNKITEAKPPGIFMLALHAILQPFNGLMLTLAVITICPPVSDKRTFALIMVFLIGAVLLRFVEEIKSIRTAQNLKADISVLTQVMRDGKILEVTSDKLVPGDIVFLSGSDVVPSDVRILEAQNLQVGMSSLTGEAAPVTKYPTVCSGKGTALDHSNIALMSSSVISGSAKCLVVGTGDQTYIAGIAATLPSGRSMNAFDYAVRRVVYLFIIFLGFMVPIVIVVSGLSTGSWSTAVALGLSVAVGLSPQMMPMIVTANLAKGATMMRKQQTVIRRLDAVQNLGAMDVLCMDKTGTLTTEQVALVKHLDASGQESKECLRLGFANAFFQAGKGNLMDAGIKHYAMGVGISAEVEAAWVKLDEVAFDFERRMLTVLLQPAADPDANPLLICKGAFEDLLLLCSKVKLGEATVAMTDQLQLELTNKCTSLNLEGLRVLALATQAFAKGKVELSRHDEADLIFQGFLVFLDPPKLAALPTIQKLTDLGVNLKVLTGDNLLVAKRLCQDLNIPSSECVLGAQLATLEDEQLAEVVEKATIFAKVTPQQKMMIVDTLQKANHICGFMGDGTNDSLALRKADVGICVDSGTDVAKEAADLIMLDKDLEKLAFGVETGRVTYGNTIKYIKFASSSSFGNTFSILAGAAWLPYNPLQPIQVLVLNLLYNISQIAIPWDTMDASFVKKPKRWSAKYLGLYMLIIGPTSSIFDMTTFLFAWHIYKANNASDAAAILEQSMWFIESLMTQTFIVHLLRTERIPFLQSRAAWPLMISSFGTMAVGVAICYIPKVNNVVSLAPPPNTYYALLVATVAAYSLTVQIFKYLYIRVFDSWL